MSCQKDILSSSFCLFVCFKFNNFYVFYKKHIHVTYTRVYSKYI
jgi:hypothetical protein